MRERRGRREKEEESSRVWGACDVGIEENKVSLCCVHCVFVVYVVVVEMVSSAMAENWNQFEEGDDMCTFGVILLIVGCLLELDWGLDFGVVGVRIEDIVSGVIGVGYDRATDPSFSGDPSTSKVFWDGKLVIIVLVYNTVSANRMYECTVRDSTIGTSGAEAGEVSVARGDPGNLEPPQPSGNPLPWSVRQSAHRHKLDVKSRVDPDNFFRYEQSIRWHPIISIPTTTYG
ncbi:hypothetical protein Sjap_019189 [Stephania japonica]|uniref:Berberine/berberine-like domain-containing protein n=1 Tax=Stephania japonica TaxID=461633 RepID=A0AAP0EY88_9MAGN